MIMTLASIFAADSFVHVRSQVFRSLRCEEIMNTTSAYAADILFIFWWQVIRILRCDDILNQASRALFMPLVASLQEFEMC